MDSSIKPLHWVIKKTARVGFAGLSPLTKLMFPARTRLNNSGIRVLTYHKIQKVARDPFSLDPQEFYLQMKWLAERNLAVSLEDLMDFYLNGRAQPPGSVLISIDDSHRTIIEEALPVLAEFKLKAVVFPIIDQIGSKNRLSWDDLKQLVQAGIDIGSHTLSHRSLGNMPLAEVKEELSQSRRILEDKLGRPVTSMAYPFGTRSDFRDEFADLLAECGYGCAFTTQHGAVTGEESPYFLPRIKVEGGDPGWMFASLCRGGMDSWRLVDSLLWRLQRPLD